jgi:hypothetical protein
MPKAETIESKLAHLRQIGVDHLRCAFTSCGAISNLLDAELMWGWTQKMG